MNNEDIDAVQSIIGYKFNNTKLLDAAFTHNSFVNEHDVAGNERIEFLGDCVLNFLVGEKMFFSDRTAMEGKLSSRRAALVSRNPLARIVDELGLIKYLRVGVGVNKAAFREKARSDVFEAIIGAVYIDGGMDSCRAVLDRIFYPLVSPERDYKSELQEYAASKGMTVKYTTTENSGVFDCFVVFGDKQFSGSDNTKHGAEISAAKNAIEALANE